MNFHRIIAGLIGLSVWTISFSLQAGIIIEETFTGYLDDALISDSPAGPAIGLTGDWTVKSPGDPDFYVNRTESDTNAGTGKAVYDRGEDFNGERTATRSTSADHVLFKNNGDKFYASFLIDPARANGHMTFELALSGLDGGGQQDFSFGIIAGQFIVGNGGDTVILGDGTVTSDEQLVVVRVVYGEAASGPDVDEIVTLWVNPVDELSTPVFDGLAGKILNRGGGKITAVSIRGDQMDGLPAFFDNLRVGTTFVPAVPEPATLSLLAFGFVILIPLTKSLARKPCRAECDPRAGEV